MKDEIKEILDLLKYCVDKNEYLEEPNMKNWKPLLDYITNLQDRINKAIELLNDWNYLDKIDCYCEPKEVIEILQGKSDE